jgi:hypothetical protein
MKTVWAVLFLVATAFTIPTAALTETEHPERWYQERWCEAHHGQTEYVLPDRTRCDCLTATHAVEVDFGRKWAEGIGQALYYSAKTNKRAGLVLILETEGDQRGLTRLINAVIYFGLPIDIWGIQEGGQLRLWTTEKFFNNISSYIFKIPNPGVACSNHAGGTN